jgi:ribosome-binding factor A
MTTPDVGRAASQRQRRVAEELRHALARILERDEVRDPGVTGRVITVTEVRISPDLRNATVFVAPLGGGDAPAVVEGLTRACSFLRRRLAEAVRLRCVPSLLFRFDDSFDRVDRIESLLRDLPAAEPSADGDEEGRTP